MEPKTLDETVKSSKERLRRQSFYAKFLSSGLLTIKGTLQNSDAI